MWRRFGELRPDRWDVLVVDFVARTLEVVAECFRSFLDRWTKGVLRPELYDLTGDESPTDWQQENRELLYQLFAESNKALGPSPNTRPNESA